MGTDLCRVHDPIMTQGLAKLGLLRVKQRDGHAVQWRGDAVLFTLSHDGAVARVCLHAAAGEAVSQE